MVAARGLRKSFGDFEAVRGIDLDVRRGEAFGFLGPNGAGKSSTMRMIAAVSPVSGGELRIFGRDPATDGPAIRGRLGVCPQDDTLDSELNVFDNLFIYGRYFGIPAAEVRERAQELLEFVQLTDKAKSKVEDLSGGMKRRLTIARSLVNKPDLLLLDEPTTGLDPQARHLLWDKLFRLKQTGVTLVITTHYMDEAEQLCDRLVVMDKGVIVAEGSPAALIQQHSTREVTELRFGLAGEDDTHEALAEKVSDLGDRVEVLPDRLLVYSDDGDQVAAKVHERGLRAGGRAGPTLHARGRLPAPDRPDLGGLMSIPQGLPVTEGVGRQVDYWLTVYRRTWKGTAISSFVAPLFYVVAMGVLLGGFIEGDPAELEGATSYLAFLVPGLVAAHAMQTAVGETTYPVMGMIKWQRIYDSMLATPLQVRDLVLAHLAFVTVRVAMTCAVFMLVVAPFGIFETWWGALLAFVSQVLVGTAFGSVVYAFTTRLSSPEGFGVLFRLGVFPLFLFSGAFFPITNLGDIGAWLARLTPLWHGVNLSRMFILDNVDWGWAAVNVAVLLALTLLGLRWSVNGLTKRLVS